MPLSLDGFDVLQRISADRVLFQSLKAETADVAERLVKRMLTSSSMDLRTFRALVAALGEETIDLVLQTMDVAEVKGLLQRIDAGRVRSEPRRHMTATRRVLKAAIDRAAPAEKPQRRTLKTVLKPLENSPFATLSMARSLED